MPYYGIHTGEEPYDSAGKCHDCVVMLPREPVGPDWTGYNIDTIHTVGGVIAVIEVYDT